MTNDDVIANKNKILKVGISVSIDFHLSKTVYKVKITPKLTDQKLSPFEVKKWIYWNFLTFDRHYNRFAPEWEGEW